MTTEFFGAKMDQACEVSEVCPQQKMRSSYLFTSPKKMTLKKVGLVQCTYPHMFETPSFLGFFCLSCGKF
jgi:hypothetical protein